MRTFILAGGCFWCLDAVYRTLRGVSGVVSGYTGGSSTNPDYRSVCTGTTGHAEAVAVTFDETVISEDVILDVFFTLHDPTQLNRQGPDVGTQYRSAMFYRDEPERALFEAARRRAADWWQDRIVTTIEPLAEFYDAEEYHQDFWAHNPEQGYCLAITRPKVQKIRRAYADYVRVP